MLSPQRQQLEWCADLPVSAAMGNGCSALLLHSLSHMSCIAQPTDFTTLSMAAQAQPIAAPLLRLHHRWESYEWRSVVPLTQAAGGTERLTSAMKGTLGKALALTRSDSALVYWTGAGA